MNAFFGRMYRIRTQVTYDVLLEMMRRKFINEKLIDHRNRASRGILPQQRQHGRVPTSHLMDHQWNQASNEVVSNSRQTLSTSILNVVPTLAYEDVILETSMKHIGPPRQGPVKEEAWARFETQRQAKNSSVLYLSSFLQPRYNMLQRYRPTSQAVKPSQLYK